MADAGRGNLLPRGGAKVATIGASGVDSEAAFSRPFKKATGLAPARGARLAAPPGHPERTKGSGRGASESRASHAFLTDPSLAQDDLSQTPEQKSGRTVIGGIPPLARLGRAPRQFIDRGRCHVIRKHPAPAGVPAVGIPYARASSGPVATSSPSPAASHQRQEFIARLALCPGSRSSTVACGTGKPRHPAARAGARVTDRHCGQSDAQARLEARTAAASSPSTRRCRALPIMHQFDTTVRCSCDVRLSRTGRAEAPQGNRPGAARWMRTWTPDDSSARCALTRRCCGRPRECLARWSGQETWFGALREPVTSLICTSRTWSWLPVFHPPP